MKHKTDCKMSFGRKDKTCPRCQELLKGALPIRSWGYEAKKANEARSRAISEHYANHDELVRTGECQNMCVRFDW